ncbi:Yip1 family protein [Yoonia sp. SS1-5]|uniref:Yip1 family protein n=1 Tax=Yoonia rhodophyticola TaxID=3137370 RepID=A0AAN0M7Z8_9RHOB
MTREFQSWMRQVWLSLIEPVPIARQVLAYRFDLSTLWTAMVLMGILSTLALVILQQVAPLPPEMQAQARVISPFAFAALVISLLCATGFAIFKVGRILDGTGTLQQTLAVFVWFLAVRLTLVIIHIVITLFSYNIGAMFGLVTGAALIWCLVNFINELHGFKNLGTALGCLILAMLAVAMVAVTLLLLAGGLQPPGGTI